MTTESQNLANRINAQKSTGPRSAEGKAVVSQNAVKHGLRAELDVISSESKADFDLYRRQILDDLNPATPMESVLAERIVSLSWRLKRAGRFQNQAIDTLHADRLNNPFKKLTQSLFPKSQGSGNVSNGELPLGRLAVKDFSNERVLDRLLMYERRIEHSLFKTMLEYQRLTIIRKMERNRKLLEGFNDQSP